jgi:hypothetical protein
MRVGGLVPLLFLLVPACASAATAPPGPLTAWRTPLGIRLDWGSPSPVPVRIWRSSAAGAYTPLATLPPGQAGFVDLSARPESGYRYALGEPGSGAPEVEIPAPPAGGPANVLAGLVTTCRGLAPGGTYPADTRNLFELGKDRVVQYFGYFVLKPWREGVRHGRLVWRAPDGRTLAEYAHSLSPRRLDLPDGPVGQIVLAMAFGLDRPVEQNGQREVPTEPGLYTIEAFLDGGAVGLTFFQLRAAAAASTR